RRRRSFKNERRCNQAGRFGRRNPRGLGPALRGGAERGDARLSRRAAPEIRSFPPAPAEAARGAAGAPRCRRTPGFPPGDEACPRGGVEGRADPAGPARPAGRDHRADRPQMVVNALNSGAKVFMADFEDANSPTWANQIEGQINLIDRWANRIDFTDAGTGKAYKLSDKPAVLLVRPRGWHLPEEHLVVDGQPMSGALFDFGLYFFLNARTTLAKGSGPCFGVPNGTIKATVLIETLPAAFEMDEILYELRDHIAGLNCGRWDYIFSFIKTLRKKPEYLLPDRGQVVMGKAFLKAYSELLIKTCHRRGAFAMGGMAAQIPDRKNPAVNEAAFAKVRADKEREAKAGHDGTWVAHPDLVPVAMEVFDRFMPTPNQLDKLREDVVASQRDLLEVHEGTRTEAGLRENIRVGVQYIEAWLRGRGAVPLYNLMEDAATAEISRSQIWQQLHFGATLEGGVRVTPDLFEKCLGEEMERVKGEIGEKAYASGKFPQAIELFRTLSTAKTLMPFLTLPAYRMIV